MYYYKISLSFSYMFYQKLFDLHNKDLAHFWRYYRQKYVKKQFLLPFSKLLEIELWYIW